MITENPFYIMINNNSVQFQKISRNIIERSVEKNNNICSQNSFKTIEFIFIRSQIEKLINKFPLRLTKTGKEWLVSKMFSKKEKYKKLEKQMATS